MNESPEQRADVVSTAPADALSAVPVDPPSAAPRRRAPLQIERLGRPGPLRALALLTAVVGLLCDASLGYVYTGCPIFAATGCAAPIAGAGFCLVVFVVLSGLLSYAPLQAGLAARTRKTARATILVIVVLLLLAQMRFAIAGLLIGPLVVLISSVAHIVNVIRGDAPAGALTEPRA